MQRTIPLAICFVMGIFMMVQFFVPHPISTNAYNIVLKWIRIITIFALVLGVGSLSMHHTTKIRRRVTGWTFSIVTIIAMIVTAVIGLIGGVGRGSWLQVIFQNIYVPVNATMFSILAFYMASAAYRAFRARTKEATILLIAAFIVMLGMVPIGAAISKRLPELAEWILTVPNTAAKRGIIFGIALGGIATSIKIILGIERGWLGGGKQ